MFNKLLLPHSYKRVGWFILIPTTVFGLIVLIPGGDSQYVVNSRVFALANQPLFGPDEWFTFTKTNVTGTVLGMLFIISALMVGFSKEKVEDEFIGNIRLASLLWAVAVNYILLLIAFALVYGMAFFNVMLYNMFTVLTLFIVRFNYRLYRNSKSAADEKLN